MEDFLNSDKFLEMAKEYNNKYSNVSMLNIDEISKENLCNLLSNLYKFFFMLSRCYRFNLKNIANKNEDLLNYVTDLEKKYQIEPRKNFKNEKILITYKSFFRVILDIYKALFEVYKKNFEKNYKLFYMILGVIEQFFSEI